MSISSGVSRFPIDARNAKDYSKILWKDFPDANLPNAASAALRLSSTGHWDVPVLVPGKAPLHFLAYHAMTPVFDGPKDENGWRNHDENRFWQDYLDKIGVDTRFVLLGDANLDPNDGEGHKQAITDLLQHPMLQDPEPRSNGAIEAARIQAGVNGFQKGDPALDTADWRDVNGPGNLRVDYVLPSANFDVLRSGVFWPATGEPLAEILQNRDPDRSWHGLVWVDIDW